MPDVRNTTQPDADNSNNPPLTGQAAESASQAETPLLQLAKEYIRLGGKRRSVVDDNVVSTRGWEPGSPEAEAFWQEKVETLDADQRKQVELYLPTINAT